MKMNLETKQNQSTVIVIPAYQPSNALIDLVDTLSDQGYKIVVVDDGSDKEYKHVWESLNHDAIIIHHPENLGKGAALKTAFSFIYGCMSGADYIITMDADGQHLPEDAARIKEAAWNRPGTLILGSRDFDQEKLKKIF